MADSDKRDLIDDLTHTVKKHPVESLLAYELLVPEKKKKEIQENAVGMGVILIGLLLVLPLLFAPAMEPILFDNLRKKCGGHGTNTVEEIEQARRKMARIRIGLWITSIVSWIVVLVVLYLANNGVNLEGY